MPTLYHLLPHAGIQSLCPYVPGKSVEELAKEKGLQEIIKLASNENPLGCSPRAREALAKMPASRIASYPSPRNHPLLANLAQQLNLPENMLSLSNGSDWLFFTLMTIFALHTQKKVLTHAFSFLSYRTQAQTLGIPVLISPVGEDFGVNICKLIEMSTLNVGLIFIANPNNPTGLLISQEKIAEILESIPDSIILVLDEAYYEFNPSQSKNSSIELLKKHKNLVITRTFSKAYGLAGLRLGYAISHPEIAELINRIQPPFTVNQAALEAANAAIFDKEFLEQTQQLNLQGMQALLSGLESLGFNCLPSWGNFITFDCKQDGAYIYEALLNKGIIVRPLHAYELNDYLRVSIGTPLQIKQFLDTFAFCLS